jgi:hypothetical protein
VIEISSKMKGWIVTLATGASTFGQTKTGLDTMADGKSLVWLYLIRKLF